MTAVDSVTSRGKVGNDYHHRFFELENSLSDAVVWASLLDKVVDDLEGLSSMSKMEVSISYGQLLRVSEKLKQAIDDMDAIYHQRPKEEEANDRVLAQGAETLA
jgi:hypothetical protein